MSQNPNIDRLHHSARGVGAALIAAEQAHNVSGLQLAQLCVAMHETQAQGDLRFGEGQLALAAIASAQVRHAETGGVIAQVHGRLAKVAGGRAIDFTSWGDFYDTEKPTAGSLTEVPAAAEHAA